MATLVRWEPFREIAALQNDMGRLMSTFLGQANGETSRTWVPAVDVWEVEDRLFYAFDLPGIPEDKISVEFDDGSLTVSGERERAEEVKNDGFYRYVNAEYRDGVLEISVKKPEAPKPRRIQVGSGSKATIEGKSQKA